MCGECQGGFVREQGLERIVWRGCPDPHAGLQVSLPTGRELKNFGGLI